MYLFAKFGGHNSYENEDINSYVNSYMTTSEKARLTASICILWRFQNQEYQFTIPKSRTWLAEKEQQKEEKDHWQLQSVMNFRQTQQNIFSYWIFAQKRHLEIIGISHPPTLFKRSIAVK